MSEPLPINTKNLIRLLVILLIVLALAAGFFHSAWQTEQKRSNYLQQQLESR